MAFDVQSYLLGLKAGKGGGPTGPVSYNDLLDKPFYVEENQLLASGTLEYDEDYDMYVTHGVDLFTSPFRVNHDYTIVFDSDQQGYTSTLRCLTDSITYLSDQYWGNGEFWDEGENAYDHIDTDVPFFWGSFDLFVNEPHTSWKIYGPVVHYLDNSYLNGMFGCKFEIINSMHIDIPAGGIDTNEPILGNYFYADTDSICYYYYLVTNGDGHKFLLPVQNIRDIDTPTKYVGEFYLLQDFLPQDCSPDYVRFDYSADFCIAIDTTGRTIIQTFKALDNLPDSLDISLVRMDSTLMNGSALVYSQVWRGSDYVSLAQNLNEILLKLEKEPVQYVITEN